MSIAITLPLTKAQTAALHAGDIVAISSTLYTARDAAHKRMLEDYEKTGRFPFDMENATIYYTGPAPAKPGQVIGPIGPTTSYRMDAYAPFLLDHGETGMIGKGKRSEAVVEAMKRNTAVYFAATGGAAALLQSHILSSEIIAYEDLGAEAIRRLEVRDLPAIVVIDSQGNDLYATEKAKYRQKDVLGE